MLFGSRKAWVWRMDGPRSDGLPAPPGWSADVLAWLAAVSEPGQFSVRALERGARAYGSAYNSLVSVQHLQVAGQALLQLRAGSDALLFVFHRHGVVSGQCSRRAVASRVGALTAIVYPREQLSLEFCPPASDQFWLRLSYSLFAQVMGTYGKQLLDPEDLLRAIQGLELALLPILEAFVRPSSQAQNDATRLGLQRLEASLMATLVRLIPDASPGLGGEIALDGLPPPTPPAPTLPQGSLCARAQRYMLDHLAIDLDLPGLALALNTSKRSLQLAFRQELDETPMQHLRLLRLERLHGLLLEGRSVAEACAAAGLPATGRTAALYKEQYGQSPTQTRLSARR